MKLHNLAIAKYLLCLVLLSLAAAVPARAETIMPRPDGLEPDIKFWVRIYSEVGTNGGLIHDSVDLRVVYDKVEFSRKQSRRTRERRIENRKKQIVKALRKLALGRRSGLSKDERRILARFPDGVSNKTLKNASRQVRFQLGQADKFRSGVARSGAWRDHIRETFEEMGVPTSLAALPHVESSFTPTAYSRVGAAGLWQFTRSTGRRYMRVDHVVDQRLDPFDATRAAGQLLLANKLITGTWPLAITAYNHGASGMRRATRKLGTTDIEKIVRRYKSRTFGFASRNFYVEFLAAREVEANAARYFGKLELAKPVARDSIELPFYARVSDLAKAMGVKQEVLRASNPSLSRLVWSNDKYVPRGFTLRVPVADLAHPLAASIEAVAPEQRHATQTRDRTHRVRRGDTLSGIAARYGTSVGRLVANNKLRSRNRIRIGQQLRLPGDGRAAGPESIPATGVYTVRRGDSISRIASRYGMRERQLLAMNQLRNRNRIYPGQSLRVARANNATKPARKTLSGDGDETRLAAAIQPEAAAAPAPAPEPARKAVTVEKPPTEAKAEQPAPIELAALPQATVAASVELGNPTESVDDTSELERDLQADPADYSVAANGTIEIQAAETLGHIAEWLDVRASRLRQLNGMRYGTPIETHRSLKLDFSRVEPAEFERRRLEHHRALQAEFFERFEISGTRIHVIKRGDSIWNLSRSAGVPPWLLQQYNPDLDMATLQAGAQLTIPELRRHGDS